MTPDSPPQRRQTRRMPRVPPFYPVPARTRREFTLSACLAGSRRGWTVERQSDFIGMLAETGSVLGACEAVGMSRKSAYRQRALPGAESFAAAWDSVLGAVPRKVTPPARDILCDTLGPVRLIMFRGRYRGSWRSQDPYAALELIDALAGGQGHTL